MQRLITKREQMITKIKADEVRKFGVKIQKDTIENTNGAIFAKITNKIPLDSDEYPSVEAQELETDTIAIKGDDLKKVKILKSKHLPIVETVLLAKHNDKVCLTTTDLSSTNRAYPEQRAISYREYRDYAPPGKPVLELLMKKENLIAALELFEKGTTITMRMYANDEAVELVHENREYKTEVLAMPLSK